MKAVVALLAFVCFSLPCAQAQSAIRHVPVAHSQERASASQIELNARIEAANSAQRSGDPTAIAEANKRLLALALRMMGNLRLAEAAYPQAAELYKSSLAMEADPALHADLAIAAQLAGQQDEAIAQAQLALAVDPDDTRANMTLSRAYIAKQEYAKAAEVLTKATRLHPQVDSLYLLAICWLEAKQPDSQQHADAVFDQMKAVAGDSGSLHVLMGRAYRDAGLMPEAVKEFKRAIELDIATPHAHYFLGLAYLSMNEWLPTPQAQAEMEKEVQYHPHDFLANYMLGFLTSSQRQYAVSNKYLKVAAGLNPTWPEPFLYMGLNAFAEGDDKAAEQLLRKAVDLTGKDEARSNYQIRRAYVDLGRILARSGREKEADVFVAKARDLENKVMQQSQQQTTALLLSKGGSSSTMGAVVPLDKPQSQAAPLADASADASARVDAAVIASSNLTAEQRETAKAEEDTLRPILGQSYSDLATSEALQHNYAAALANYQQAELWDPEISDLMKNLGQAAYRMDNYPEAVRGLSAAVKENPDALALRAMLGMAYFDMQKYGDAANTFYPLGPAAMQDSMVGYAWAASLARTGDFKDASQVLSVYEGGSLSNEGLLLVGQLWTEIGDYDKAIAAFRQILTSDASFPKAHYFIALADIRAEKWSDARAELNAELAVTPGDPDAMYNLGFVDLQESKNDDAQKLFEQVIAKHPDYANAQYQLGKLLMDGGKTQDGLPRLEDAARLSPDKDYVHYQLQAAYRRLGRTADADRELAVYQQIKAKSRAASQAKVNQQLQQKP